MKYDTDDYYKSNSIISVYFWIAIDDEESFCKPPQTPKTGSADFTEHPHSALTYAYEFTREEQEAWVDGLGLAHSMLSDMVAQLGATLPSRGAEFLKMTIDAKCSTEKYHPVGREACVRQLTASRLNSTEAVPGKGVEWS